MKPQKWNVQNAALYGAACGFPVLLLLGFFSTEPLATRQADLVLYFSGAVLGGAALFVSIAALKNFTAK